MSFIGRSGWGGMSYGIRLHVWGERACFTRPEMKVERVSYDVMTPSAARGIMEAVHWKPAILWVIDRIHVLRPIRFQSLRRNEVGAKISAGTAARAMRAGSIAGLGLSVEENRQQRAATLLVDVGYVIEAHFELTAKAGDGDTPAKHASMFNRRAASGQCFHRPCLGTREFPADFELIPDGAALPDSTLPSDQRDRDLGWMLHDIDHANGVATSRFFRARLTGGVLDVQRCLLEGVAA
jgi:CRISPR-associated protein Cas5d